MNEGFQYGDIIILALIAGFLVLRLRGVLGQKIGHEKPPLPSYPREESETPVVQKAEKVARAQQQEEKDSELLQSAVDASARPGIEAITQADKDFSLERFLHGARAAFEMLFDAFVKGDRETLKMLLSPALYKVFSDELDQRANQERRKEITLLSVLSQHINAASLTRNTAQITLRFVSEQVTVTRDEKGAIVEGDPTQAEHVEDEWVFERDITSRNPNWKVIDT